MRSCTQYSMVLIIKIPNPIAPLVAIDPVMTKAMITDDVEPVIRQVTVLINVLT